MREHEHKPTTLDGRPFVMFSHKPDGASLWIHLCVCAICGETFTTETIGAHITSAIMARVPDEPQT